MTGWVSIHLVCQGPSFLFAAIKSWNCMRTPTLEGEDQVRKDLTDGIVTKWTANAWMVWIHFACSMLLVVRLTWPEHRNWLSKKSCHRTRLGSVSLNTFHNFHRCCYCPFPGFYFRRISDWFKESWRERWNQSLWHIREKMQIVFFVFFWVLRYYHIFVTCAVVDIGLYFVPCPCTYVRNWCLHCCGYGHSQQASRLMEAAPLIPFKKARETCTVFDIAEA